MTDNKIYTVNNSITGGKFVIDGTEYSYGDSVPYNNGTNTINTTVNATNYAGTTLYVQAYVTYGDTIYIYAYSNENYEFANYTISTLTKNPTKTGYTYKGYYKSTSSLNACDGILVIGVDKKMIKTKSLLDSFADNQILYPCYVANKYTVTFDKNTGEILAEGRDNVNTLIEAYGDNCTIEIW